MAAAGKAVKTKLFIGNLDPATQTAELSELFASFGNVMEASVIKDYGFVHYGTIEEAEKAVAGLNNKEFHGKRLRVELSTSTVRHRPGQPEPASALRHPRTRHGVGGVAVPLAMPPGGSHPSRYANPVPPAAGGVGPMRHSAAWARHDARPYAPPENRNYYGDASDAPYPPAYDVPPYGSHRNGDDADAYGSRQYRDVHARPPPPPPPPEPMNYAPHRGYERHADLPPGDLYYDDSDPYRNNYDAYAKYYHQARGRPEPDYAGAPPPSRDYDPYANYRPDPYAPSNGQAPYRHPANVASPSQHHGGYPPNPRQQPPLYPSGGSAAAAAHSHYYGAHHRA